MARLLPLLLLSAGCSACSSPSHAVDAAAGGDGPCGGLDYFTGDVEDWDSNASFCGVFAATFTAGSATDSTAPNGRFQLCLADAPTTRVAVTPPSATSQCAPSVGTYQLPGIAIASHAVIASGATISYRMIGMNRLMPFFTAAGLTYDSTKALVFVHVAGTTGTSGTTKAVTSSAAHAAPLAFDGTAWGSASSDTGQDVLFANSDITAGTTTVSFSDGTGIGSGTFPIAAGTFTYVTLVAN